MKKYRKIPVEVEAAQFIDRWSADQIIDWAGKSVIRENVDHTTGRLESLTIETLEGPMRCPKSWWVIKGVKGEFYSCAPDVFEQTYEDVE